MSSFSGFNTTPSSNPLNIAQRAPVNMVFVNRSPAVQDNNYEIGTEWENTTTFVFYKLIQITWNTMTKHSDAIWSLMTPGSGVATNLTDQTNQQVVPDGSANINVIGDGTVMTSTKTGASQLTIAITGIVPVPHGGTGVNTITDHAVMIGQGTSPIATVGPLTDGQLVIGSTGVDPVAANLTSVGGSITITNGAGSINLETSGGSGAVSSIGVDAHTAPGTDPVVPTGGGLITVTGGQAAAGTIANSIQTNSLAANTYTIQVQRSSAVAATDVTKNGVAHFNNADFTVDANAFVTLNGSTSGAVTKFTDDFAGTATPIAGDILVHSGNNLTVTAGGNALSYDVTGTTQHAVQVGSASGALTSIPLGTTGQALVAAGGFADPAFGTLPIIGGGTNATSYSTTFGTLYFDGVRFITTATGTAGQVLTSNGPGAAPTYQPAGGGGSGAWIKIAVANPSGSTNVVFNSGITSTYNNYAIIFQLTNVNVSNEFFGIQLSSDGGATYLSDYNGGYSSVAVASGNWGGSNTTHHSTMRFYNNGFGIAATNYFQGTIWLYNLTSGSGFNSLISDTLFFSGSAGQTPVWIKGLNTQIATSLVVNAIRVRSEGTETMTGTITLYGIVT